MRRLTTSQIVIRVIAFMFVLAIVGAILWPVGEKPMFTPRSTCLSHLKQIDLGMSMYVNDYDELGPGRKWIDLLRPYVGHPESYDEPLLKGDHYGYAMSRKIVRRKMGGKEDNTLVSFFDSSLVFRNAVSGLETMPSPPRHKGKNNVAFADGHAKPLPPTTAP